MIADSISWGQFALYMGGAASVYYAYLFFTGTRSKPFPGPSSAKPPPGKEKAAAKGKTIWQIQEPSEPPQEATEEEQEQDDQSFLLLESLAEEVHGIISQSGELVDKEELLSRLAAEVNRYPLLNQSAFRSAIGNIIIKAAKADCLIDITRAETEALWGQP